MLVGACLSLSGRYAKFGRQCGLGLRTWRNLTSDVELVVEDDQSDPRTLEIALPRLARRCDLLLGTYSTHLMRTAGRLAVEQDWLLWNHGGAGDQVQQGFPGHVVSVLAPTSRYAEPFVRYLATESERAELRIACGQGSFGRQVAEGAERIARRLGVRATRFETDERASAKPWNLFSAGSFEADVDLVKRARTLRRPPRTICAVAAGVEQFAHHVTDVEGLFGVAQWLPGTTDTPEVGPTEAAFLAEYARQAGTTMPDYPAVQTAAAATIATTCARVAGGGARNRLWSAATHLETSTFFGKFRNDPETGAQNEHQLTLVRWSENRRAPVPPTADSPR